MIMSNEQKEKLHAVRIPCNSTVKNYTFATLKRLGLDEKPGKVYNDIVYGNGAIPKSVYAATTKAKTLLEMIPKFHPPVPVTAAADPPPAVSAGAAAAAAPSSAKN